MWLEDFRHLRFRALSMSDNQETGVATRGASKPSPNPRSAENTNSSGQANSASKDDTSSSASRSASSSTHISTEPSPSSSGASGGTDRQITDLDEDEESLAVVPSGTGSRVRINSHVQDECNDEIDEDSVEIFKPSSVTSNHQHIRLQDIDLESGTNNRTSPTTLHLRPRNKKTSDKMATGGVDTDMLEKQELTDNKDTEAPDGYITTLDKDGNIKEVPVGCDESSKSDDPVEGNPLADFMSTDILTKPFNFVAGNATKSRFNPFRKKSGLLNVLARQSTRNRIVGKNGSLNIINSAEGKSHKFFKDIFISIIDLNWGWIFFMFAAAFFLSWLGFAVLWYITFYVHGDFEPENIGNDDFVPCASEIKDFTSCFLFSLETQHTIGYGGR